jgi:hypothetical protein
MAEIESSRGGGTLRGLLSNSIVMPVRPGIQGQATGFRLAPE